MLRKIILVSFILLIILQSPALAAIETQGDVIFRDALYGAAVGAIIGGAFYLADQNDFGTKLGIGVAIGTVGGLVFGVVETRSIAEIRNDDIKFSLPTPVIEKRQDDTRVSMSLLRIDLD